MGNAESKQDFSAQLDAKQEQALQRGRQETLEFLKHDKKAKTQEATDLEKGPAKLKDILKPEPSDDGEVSDSIEVAAASDIASAPSNQNLNEQNGATEVKSGPKTTEEAHDLIKSDRSSSTSSEDPLTSWNARKEKLPRPSTASSAQNGGNSRASRSLEPQPPKRSAAASDFIDERRDAVKKEKLAKPAPSITAPASQPASSSAEIESERKPPEWYRKLKFDARNGRDSSGVDQLLARLKDQIGKVEKGKDPANMDDVRESLHKVAFQTVNKQMLRNTKMLSNEEGLPRVFDPKYIKKDDKGKSVPWPFDIKADAEELYNKWSREDFETDLMRGIKCGKPKVGKDTSDRSSDKLDERWPKINANYYGNGQLLNGQWWPTQLTCLRDGAHGSSQGGISGGSKGAYSCTMSGGHGYGEDEDHGDWVMYCGTDCKDGTGKTTEGTQQLIASVGKEPVRLIRSHHLNSEWAPQQGFRYDGLYDVVDYERVDPVGNPRARHRFKLVRQAGQDPIRGGNGPERRPTAQELKAFEDDKRLRGF